MEEYKYLEGDKPGVSLSGHKVNNEEDFTCILEHAHPDDQAELARRKGYEYEAPEPVAEEEEEGKKEEEEAPNG